MDPLAVETRRPALIDVRRCGILLGGVTVGLGVISYAMHLATRAVGADSIETLDVGDEVSLGTWYESLLFILAAVVLFVAGRRDTGPPRRFGWNSMAVVMTLLSIDEAASIHERFGSVLDDAFESGGYLHQLWVIPGAIFTLGVLVGHLPWLRALPATLRNRMVLGGALFVIGAIGLEIMASPLTETGDDDTLSVVTLIAIEEFLEMTGLCVFIVAVLDHLRGVRDSIEIR